MGLVATSYLSKTLDASNRKTWTFSTWCKVPCNIADDQVIFANSYSASSANFMFIAIRNDYELQVQGYTGGAQKINIRSKAILIDPSSWYHLVFRCDTTQATASNRFRMYINNKLVEEFSANTIPDQNQDLGINMNVDHRIGNFAGLNRNFYGLLAHTHFADGQSYAPTTFGEYDSTTGEWKAILSPSVTYSTNGFFLKYENASNFGVDSSGQSNNMATSGTFRQDTDTPSNNFQVLDRNKAYDITTIDHSGTAWLGTSSALRGCYGTMYFIAGKWYAEFKPASARTTADATTIGIVKNGTHANLRWVNEGASGMPGKETASNGVEGITYQPMTGTPNLVDDGGGGTVNYGVQASANDIIMMALDVSGTTGKLWFGKNGTWFNAPGTSSVGNPATGANAGISFAKGDEFWGITVSSSENSGVQYMYCNFGRGCFGTTAVSSGNADGNSQGIFEYAPPSGFYAMCTKNLKDYG